MNSKIKLVVLEAGSNTISSNFNTLFYPFKFCNILISLFIFFYLTIAYLIFNTWFQSLDNNFLKCIYIDSFKNFCIFSSSNFSYNFIIVKLSKQ